MQSYYASGGPSVFEKIFSVPGKILGFLFQNSSIAKVSLFTIFLITMFLGSVSDAVTQKSMDPIIDNIGGGIFGADVRVEEYTNKLFSSPSFTSNLWGNIKVSWELFGSLYYIYFIFWILMTIWLKVFGENMTGASFVTALVILIALQVTWGAVELGEVRIPFKGCLYFISMCFSTLIPSIRDTTKDIYLKLGTAVGA